MKSINELIGLPTIDNNTGAARMEDGAAVTMQELAAQGIPGAEEGISSEESRKYLLTSDRATAQEYTEKHSDYLYRLVAVESDGVYYLLYKPVCTPPINGALIESMVRRAYALDDNAAQVIRAMQAEA